MYFSATASSEKDDGMPVKRSRRPLQRRLPDLFLDIGNDLTGIGLVPAPVQVLRREASPRFSKAAGVGTATMGVAQ